MTDTPTHVDDINGVRYRLRRLLGRGGQGAVYEVEGGRLAVKIISTPSPQKRERLRNQLTMVKRLDLNGVEIARPHEMLREPILGYVMEMLTGMQPLSVLATAPKDAKSTAEWYISTGGLRRRLGLLARGADALASLHGKGLAYADPSLANIFISEGKGSEVRLIDADNLRYAGTPGIPSVYTPGFGAPELVNGKWAVSTLTDAHAFSVVAFKTLALCHPLIGDRVNDGEPELENDALAGRLPWIEHSVDESNRASFGIQRDIVLSKRLRALACQAFEAGLRDPLKRPGVAEWAECLHAAADATVTCPSCGGTYFCNKPQCPWCDDRRPTFALVRIGLWDPEHKCVNHKSGDDEDAAGLVTNADGTERDVAALSITEGERRGVTERLAFGGIGATANKFVLDIGLNRDRLTLRALDGAKFRLIAPTGRTSEVSDKPVEVPLGPASTGPSLHFGPDDKLHRVMRFKLHTGAKG